MAKSQWSKLDYFLPMSLVKEENALKDIKSGKIATKDINANKVFEGFLGRLNVDMQLNTLPNYDYDNFEITAFVYFNEVENQDFNITVISDSTSRISLSQKYYTNPINRIEARYNGTTVEGGRISYSSIPFIISKTLYTIDKYSGNGELYINGVYQEGAVNSAKFPSGTIFNIGDVTFNSSIISLCSIGGFSNQIAKNDIYREFLTDLGIDLTPDFNKLAGATITDTLQGATVADELVGT